ERRKAYPSAIISKSLSLTMTLSKSVGVEADFTGCSTGATGASLALTLAAVGLLGNSILLCSSSFRFRPTETGSAALTVRVLFLGRSEVGFSVSAAAGLAVSV